MSEHTDLDKPLIIVHEQKLDGDHLDVAPNDITVFTDKSTGTDTERAGYRDMMSAVEAGDLSRVIASEVSRVSRSVRDFSATVERIVDDNDTGCRQ